MAAISNSYWQSRSVRCKFVLGITGTGVLVIEQNLKGRCSLCGMGGSQGMRLQPCGLLPSAMENFHAGLTGRQKPGPSRFRRKG